MAICAHYLDFQHERSSRALVAWAQWIRTAVWASAPLFFAAFAICTQAKELSPNIKDLIGMTNGSNTDEYPLGWIKMSGCTFGQSLILCSILKNGKQEGLILQRKDHQPKTIGESVPTLITDAIAIKNARSFESLAFYCYPKQSDPQKTEGFEIFAEVRFAKRCDVKTTLIQRAWTMNLSSGKFEQIHNTSDLVCEYGNRFRGEPEFRSGCPGYSPMPSQ